MNKTFATILFLVCIICFTTVLAANELTPSQRVELGEAISMNGEECREILFDLFNITEEHITDPNDPSKQLSTLSIDPYEVSLMAPMEGLKWWNFTDVRVDDLKMAHCTIDKDIHGYAVEVLGLDTTIAGHFSYQFEPFMPVVEDKGNFKAVITNATILARVDVNPVDSHFYRSMEEFLEHYDDPDASDANDDEDETTTWEAEVLTFIPTLEVTTSDTPHKEFYDKLLKEHNFEVRSLLSVMSNLQLKEWMEDWCNEDGHCTRSGDEMAALLNRHMAEQIDEEDDDGLNELIQTDVQPTNPIPSAPHSSVHL